MLAHLLAFILLIMATRAARLARFKEETKEHDSDSDSSTSDLVYRATLATLVRFKLKVPVPPLNNNGLFDYDKLHDEQRPIPHGERLDPDHPPRKPYSCHLKCETCFTQTFPARIAVTDPVALAQITTLTTTIDNNLDHLRAALRDHADYIVTKWRKSKGKRASVLAAICAQHDESSVYDLKADAVSLYKKKWAAVHLIDDRSRDAANNVDAKSLLKGSPLAEDPAAAFLAPHLLSFMEHMVLEDQKDRYLTTWLLPYLNVESLVDEPLLFLSLLNARTAHSPVSPSLTSPAWLVVY